MIAFMSWLMVGALAGPVPLTEQGHAFHPVWAPDGRQLAFEVNRLAGAVRLYVVPVDGDAPGTPVRVALPRGGGFSSGARVAANPVWHPTHGLVFEGTDPSGHLRLFGWTGSGAASELGAFDTLPGDLTFPSVAPSGLLFVAGATGAGDVRLQGPTGQSQRLTTTPDTEAFPLLSPDGTKVLYTRKVQGAEDVFELDLAARQEVARATGSGDQTRPVYAAGDALVYFDGARGVWDLVSSQGSTLRTLARNVRLPLRARPALSPDRKWVAFARQEPADGSTIDLVRIDGSATVPIETSFTACGEPSLTQQGGRTLLAFTALPSHQATWRFLYVMDVTGRI